MADKLPDDHVWVVERNVNHMDRFTGPKWVLVGKPHDFYSDATRAQWVAHKEISLTEPTPDLRVRAVSQTEADLIELGLPPGPGRG